MSLEPSERRMTARYSSKCCLCGAVLKPGQTIIWSREFGSRCDESDEVGGEDQCVGLLFGPEDDPGDWGDQP